MADVEQWITVNGVHIPIMKGSSKEETIANFLNKKKQKGPAVKKTEVSKRNPIDKDNQTKEKQIAENKKQAEDTAKKESESDKISKTTPENFGKALNEAKASRPESDAWRVDDTHTTEDYVNRGCQCYTSSGGSTVAVDKDGDIISVCKKAGDKSIRGSELLAEAVRMGGRKLDSFDGNHDFYTENGFEPTSYTTFNEEYAPAGWKESGCGREDVIFYRYVGIGKVKYTDLEAFKQSVKPYTGENGYDEAMKYRDSLVGRNK